ncbi:MAG: calcium-translocating P-type ATPase, PMCA-type [Methanobrevibacter sp.]|jgi:Ca2+-transporting ATPase|nr:calcium-translocating P-type ATPase, PMCA-type [Candidatus Methanovirga meridionalis]
MTDLKKVYKKYEIRASGITDLEKVYKKYESRENGLTDLEVIERIKIHGNNELMEDEKDSYLKIFIMQFMDLLIFLLIVAAIAGYFVGDVIDSIVILLVVLLNGSFGFIQEYRSGKAMEKLKSLVKTDAIVRRNGQIQKVGGDQITIGDIVIVEEGDKIPADLIIVDSSNLKIDESSLTGESFPVTKSNEDVNLLEVDKDSHDENMRKAIAYMDSNVISGRGTGIVIAIGMNTSIGKIAQMINEKDKATPLQNKIKSLSKTLGLIAIVVCVIVFILQYLKGVALVETFMTAVSLAVAAIPEGLPAVLTLTLALGMQRMAKSNALVKKLLAVETLGSCTVVCSDKTGTLTLNKMEVKDARVMNSNKSFEIATLCNNASIKDGKGIGDPTDVAVLNYGLNNGYEKLEFEKTYPRIKEHTLDSVRKRMTTVHKVGEKLYFFSKGAPEIILEKSKYLDNDGTIEIINDESRNKILTDIKEMTNSALRVLGLAYREVDYNFDLDDPDLVESELIFVGLLGMMDPPREEAKNAVKSCKTAGIKVVMITGDHQSTASSIAREIGILTEGKVLTGQDLDELSNEEFDSIVEDVEVYARVFPEQKVRIVEALQNHDNIVSMTGDGVNDAPALKKASIGVGMGSGTDVSKEAADMIIQDDNFATIIKAIKEGRKIFDNIQRFVKFQVSTNVGAILTIVSASILNLPIPFTPVQILWINIMMDGPPAQTLGMEGSERNIMNRKPGKGDILSKNILIKVFIAGIVMTVGTLLLFAYELNSKREEGLAMTMAFTVFVVYQLFNAINNRAKSNEKNNFFWIAISASFLLQLLIIYIPFLQTIFKTTGLEILDWILILIVSSTILIAERISSHFLDNK